MGIISYNGYCALGGAENPRLFSRAVYNGNHFMFIRYYLIDKEYVE